MELYSRTLRIDLPQGQSAFLWGPRKTGKSTLLRMQFPAPLAGYVDDYLKEEVFDEGLTRNVAAFSRFFDALQQRRARLRRRLQDRTRVLPDSRRHPAGRVRGAVRRPAFARRDHPRAEVLPCSTSAWPAT